MVETDDLPRDPVIEAYKKDVDRILIRENLRRTPEERLRNLFALQRAAEELRRAGRKGVPMKTELFDDLLESVREGGEILRGERAPSRSFHFEEPDVRSLREKHGLSQSRFAAMMGISVGTLRNWEQGRRKPEGSARVLLKVVEKHPEAVFDVVSNGGEEKYA